MTVVSVNITTELLAHADGRPVAYIDATAVAVFAYQQPDGTYVIDICTRDDIPERRLRMLLDGCRLLRASTDAEPGRHQTCVCRGSIDDADPAA